VEATMQETGSTSGLTPQPEPCQHCKQVHLNGPCPHVKAVEYYPDGSLKRVEYALARIPTNLIPDGKGGFSVGYSGGYSAPPGPKPEPPKTGSGVVHLRPKF
jgi:hypothetical protein